MLRKLVPFGAAIVLAFLVVAFVRLIEAAPGVTYGLIGFAGGVLLVVGTRFAFADSLKDGRGMKPHKAAVLADEDERQEATAEHELLVFGDGRDRRLE